MFFNFQECFYYFDCHFMQTLLEMYQHQIKMLVNFLNFFTQDWYLRQINAKIPYILTDFQYFFNSPYYSTPISLFFTKIFTYPCYPGFLSGTSTQQISFYFSFLIIFQNIMTWFCSVEIPTYHQLKVVLLIMFSR